MIKLKLSAQFIVLFQKKLYAMLPALWKFQFSFIPSFKKFWPLTSPSPLEFPVTILGVGIWIISGTTHQASWHKQNYVEKYSINVSIFKSLNQALIHAHSQHVHVRSTSVSHSMLYVISQTKMIQKTAGNLRCHCWFPCKIIQSVKWAQKIHTDNICHLVIQLYLTNLYTQIWVVL